MLGDLEMQVESCNLSIKDEQRAHNDIKVLKESLKFVDQFAVIKPKKEALRDEKAKYMPQRKEHSLLIDEQTAVIEQMRFELKGH